MSGDLTDDVGRDDQAPASEFEEELELLVAAGFYEPGSDDAPNVRALLEYLLGLGMSIPEIMQAREENRLMSAGALRLLRPTGARMTLSEIARRADIDESFAIALWRAAGFPDPRQHERRFGTRDVALFDLARAMRPLLGEEGVLQLMRAYGSGIAHIADAEIALLRARLEAPLVDTRQWVDIARAYVTVVDAVLPRISESIDTLHRHYLDAIARRYNDAGNAASVTNVVMLAVGFADLAGFTGLALQLDAQDLGTLLARFEAITGDVVAAAGGQVIKRIGDAVMFVTAAPGVGCQVALDLLKACAEARLPKLRVGLAFGEVIARQGDVYGPTVNLAARLVSAADPGVVLTDAAMRDRLASVVGDYSFHAAGRYSLAGIDHPVETFQLLRS